MTVKKTERKFIKRIEMFNHPKDFSNMILNTSVLIISSVFSLFTELYLSILLVSVGVGINLLYFILSYLTADVFWDEIRN